MKASGNFWILVFVFWMWIFATACTSNEIGDSKDVAQDKIYQEYNVSYAEGDEKLTASAVFRFAGSNGTTLVLNKPSKVELDDELIKVDSNDLSGAFYELNKFPAQWFGKHQWKFTDLSNQTYTNDFSFDEFKWDNPPSSTIKSKQLVLHFNTIELNADDYIEVNSVETDSSFSITQKANQTKPFTVTIPVAQLQRQKQPFLKLEVTRVQKIKLINNTAEGGEFITRYSLKPVSVQLK